MYSEHTAIHTTHLLDLTIAHMRAWERGCLVLSELRQRFLDCSTLKGFSVMPLLGRTLRSGSLIEDRLSMSPLRSLRRFFSL